MENEQLKKDVKHCKRNYWVLVLICVFVSIVAIVLNIILVNEQNARVDTCRVFNDLADVTNRLIPDFETYNDVQAGTVPFVTHLICPTKQSWWWYGGETN